MRFLRTLLATLSIAFASPALAQTTMFGDANAPDRLTIWAATDPENINALIQSYLQKHPNLAINYRSMQSRELYEEMTSASGGVPDIAISSAADLQVKLVNDGYALTHKPPGGIDMPDGTNWRDQAFGFTAEPAVIVYSKRLAALGPLPRTRLDLAAMISQHEDVFTGKVATYDVARSGVGYLFATKDSLYSSTYTTLTETFGHAKTRLFCCSNDMLDLIDKGEILVAYNVLGSYASKRLRSGSQIEIVLPQDYTLILSRVAILPKGARRSDLGASFLDFLLSPGVNELLPSFSDYENLASQEKPKFTRHPIVLGPALLVFLDRLKQARFTRDWRKMIAAED